MVKHLVLCFDGTWNSADSAKSETNVARLARAVRANSGGVEQITFYLRGVGSTGIALQRLVEGAAGEGIDENIRAGYMFLAQNYVPAEAGVRGADRIFLFGFSRGAFTARSLAGFIASAGLLKRQKLGDINAAWDYYRNAEDRKPENFCRLHGSECHTDVAIDFLGVWDTVGALGIPGTVMNNLAAGQYRFHDTSPSRIIKVGRHALAVDEHRDEFEPTLWTGKAADGSDIGQMWFAGAHSDVGGGYEERRLADIPLRWMAEEAMAAGLKLDESMLPEGAPDPLAPQHDSRQGLWLRDRLTPTIREVAQKPPEVGIFERLYRPRDAAGNDLPTINEALHPSLKQRFGAEVTVLSGDDDKVGDRRTYEPKNLAPILGT
ncbi:DUF2235 domain-containing protein [Falsiroseomonas sp. HW251]|uniref:DUF2235 domain-containing protein n=1 Tax=Falsiroseomonas sp. HW251 TaxID=3390998 RepID=UPI003D31E039